MRRLAVVVVTLMLVLCFGVPAFAQGAVTVEVNGNEVNFPDQEPFIDPATDRTYVPLRFVSEALGGDVDWKGQEQIATVDRAGKHIEMEIGSKAPTVDGEEKSLDAPARLTNARTVVPLRFVSEALGAKVEWIANTRTVVITDQGGIQQPQEPEQPQEPGDTYTKHGYTIPKEDTTKLMVSTTPAGNVKRYEIGILVNLDFPLEPQYEDLHTIIESKFGKSTADEVLNHVKQNKTRFDDLEEKRWQVNRQTIRAYSVRGALTVNVEIWREGASI